MRFLRVSGEIDFSVSHRRSASRRLTRRSSFSLLFLSFPMASSSASLEAPVSPDPPGSSFLPRFLLAAPSPTRNDSRPPCEISEKWKLLLSKRMVSRSYCSFDVSPWSDSAPLALPELTLAPTWAVLHKVLPMLYSLDGISTIASANGDPLHTENSRLDSVNIGITKVKVEIMLDSNTARVEVVYPRLPPKCLNCNKYGHLLNRCPSPLLKKVPPNKNLLIRRLPIQMILLLRQISRSRANSRSRALSTPPSESVVTDNSSAPSQKVSEPPCSLITQTEDNKKSYSKVLSSPPVANAQIKAPIIPVAPLASDLMRAVSHIKASISLPDSVQQILS
ncbi:hypothetical protein EUTSA_v10001871mg [Eutrema salsugineum]|uniref:CCHC-type domain-containing protein n=1 Tax=Eutrema salsugineum TaxID=72664 RepID=V4N1G1_EUTSA|nr:hypothetical protein EUTSA_v10001871mg [Eutrema salsugineum]